VVVDDTAAAAGILLSSTTIFLRKNEDFDGVDDEADTLFSSIEPRNMRIETRRRSAAADIVFAFVVIMVVR
jgi:hypothetical protein